MALRLHNTLSQKKEPFETIEPGHARVYVCGPTVYDLPHLGHARSVIVYDVLVRHLRASGLRVTFVRNVTDVDDKILKRAKERDESPTELATRFTNAYREDMTRLGNLAPDAEPRVSDHISEIHGMIATLIENGYAYPADGDVYFAVESFPEYGKLSHRSLADLKAGASERLDEEKTARKRHPADFALWKGAKESEWGWPSPWGYGRPGWHIECSAMATTKLGATIDLHGGGLDLVFPHHENEIAQSECATGKPFSRFWVHNGFVEVDNEKMAKSKGNFFTARDLFERVEPEAIRWFMMTVHYRSPLSLDWTLDAENRVSGFPQIEEAERRVAYLYSTRARLESLPRERIADATSNVPVEIALFESHLAEAMDDDLNMPVALAKVSELLRAVNELCDAALRKKGKASRDAIATSARAFEALGKRLGLGIQEPDAVLARIRERRALARGITADHVEAKIRERAEARAQKDFARADAVRDELLALGVELHDGASGTGWSIP